MKPQGKNSEWLRQIQKEKGIEIKSLVDEPVLASHLHWIWQAFTDLSYRRTIGFSGPLPITYSDILAYCHLKNIDNSADRERLVRHLEALDREHMAQSYKEKASDNPPQPTVPRHRTDVPRHARRAPTREVPR